jgi:hypothetical protein
VQRLAGAAEDAGCTLACAVDYAASFSGFVISKEVLNATESGSLVGCFNVKRPAVL